MRTKIGIVLLSATCVLTMLCACGQANQSVEPNPEETAIVEIEAPSDEPSGEPTSEEPSEEPVETEAE